MKVTTVSLAIANGVLLYSNVANAANSTDSLKDESSTIAKNLMSLYTTNLTTTGVLPTAYPWSAAAALFSTMINYAFYTADTTYSDTVSQGLESQIGSSNDFSPSSESSSETNADQALWALACMTAVETGFKNPSDKAGLGWLGFAENVWGEQSTRWNSSVKGCKGGLAATTASGGASRDGRSTGYFFELTARLARYTGNVTYENAAETVYSWAVSEGVVGTSGEVFEGFSSSDDCSTSDVNKTQWSDNAGSFIAGTAHMFNVTSGATTWKSRLTTLLNNTLKTFTPNGDGILLEANCERSLNCTTTAHIYKSLLASSLISTLSVAPFTTSQITPVIQSSANGAIKSCYEGSPSNGTCGAQWTWGKYDGSTGVGQDAAALTVVHGLLVNGTSGFMSQEAGGATATTTGGSGGSGTGTSSGASGTSTKKSGAEKVVLGSSILLGVVAMVFVGLL